MFGGTPGAIWYLLTIHHTLVTSMKEKTCYKVPQFLIFLEFGTAFLTFLRSKIQLNLSLCEHFTFSLTVSPTEWSSAQVFFTYDEVEHILQLHPRRFFLATKSTAANFLY